MDLPEMFVSAIVSLLVENLTPGALSFIPYGRIDDKIKEWRKVLLLIESVLTDAEDRQFTEPSVQRWLHHVQNLVYEIEDFVDDFATEARSPQVMDESESSRPSKLRKFFSGLFSSKTSSTSLTFNPATNLRIGEITISLLELEKTKNKLGLREYVGGKFERVRHLRDPSTSLVDPALVYGREEDNAAILSWLLEEDRMRNHDIKVRIISIVGMGGIGKTTLAQSLYNNGQVEGCFHDRVWVCVTDDFDVFRISKIIYENVYEKSCKFDDLNIVQQKLREKLSNRKFLLVLDDVWNQDHTKWDLLSAPFHGGAPQSTIIVTTRSQDVAKTVGSKKVYDLKELSDRDCLSLLAQHAFERPNFDGYPEFKEVGEVMAKKCKGLPLAAKSLGGLLRTKGSLKQWIEVSTSKIWELQTNGIMPALRLSYHHLSPDLKPLFVYCSLFPKAFEFDQQELIMLWMAQGYLRKSEGQKQMEELGCEYFSELLSRSFFQRSTRNESRFVMHDLNNDLAQFVAGFICLRLDSEMKRNEQYKVSEEVRHASFISHNFDDFKKIKAFNAAPCLRTILPIREKSLGFSYLSNLVLKDFPRLSCLRALSLNGYCINELPKSIGSLNHLRYLDLSSTNIKELPKSICDFSNLQTLLLHGCRELVKLPTSIRKLINLRHLVIVHTPSLKEIPLGIGLLTHLRTLSKFIIDKSEGRKISELKSLHHLQGTISIIGMENVMNVQDAMEANLSGKEGLNGLEMKWNNNFGTGIRKDELEFDILDALKPRVGIESLTIKFYGGHKFPRWIGHHLFHDMVKLRLIGCKNCTHLPPLGQLSLLKKLFIKGMDGVKIVGPEFFGSGIPNIAGFHSLIRLCFMDMGSWGEWSSESTKKAFPCLEELQMSGCLKLNKVSLAKIPSLGSLKIYSCSETVLRSMVGIGSVKKLEVYDISGLSKLDEGIIGCLGEVEDLTVYKCRQLRYLWEEVACHVLEKLKSLSVSYCEQLESLGDKEQLLPHNLECLHLECCDKLEKMPNWQNSLTSLRQLTIQSCMKLQDLGMGQINGSRKHGEYDFSNLESVSIVRCPSLKWFPTGKKLPTTLRLLSVESCENMEGVEKGMFLPLLESFYFDSWSNIKSLPQGLTYLTRLYISGCSGIESIPKTSLPPTLQTLQIRYCINLKYFLCANDMQSLTSLRYMIIVGCENLEGYPSGRQWPPKLEYLSMGDVKRPIKEWGLATLPTSLRTLRFFGDFPQLVSFSEVGSQLTPTATSITCLEIWFLKKLKYFGTGLENLTSLQHLYLYKCPELEELPEPLLPTLSSLQIYDCPVVRDGCKKEKRDYWPKIFHIPCLKIDDESIINADYNLLIPRLQPVREDLYCRPGDVICGLMECPRAYGAL